MIQSLLCVKLGLYWQLKIAFLFSSSDNLEIRLMLFKLSLKRDDFETSVVCPSCHSIYDYSKCFEIKFGQKECKKCSHVFFPNHSHISHRKPLKVYCYKSLCRSIEQLIKKIGFIDKRESREVPDGYLCDIYDGTTWKHFNSQDKDFFYQILTATFKL